MTLAETAASIEKMDGVKEVPHVQAVAVLPADEIYGESVPAMIRCDDDRVYVVKTFGEPSRRGLLGSDLCFTRLARALQPDLSPEMTVVEFPAQFVKQHDLSPKWRFHDEIPPGVGSLRITAAREARLRGGYEEWDPVSLAWVIAFQTWCGGYDASAIVQDNTLHVWTIDHAHFAGPETIEAEHGEGKHTVFVPLGMERGSALLCAAPNIDEPINAIEALPEATIVQAFAGVESSWSMSAKDRACAVHYLVRRKLQTRKLIAPWLACPTELSKTPCPDDM